LNRKAFAPEAMSLPIISGDEDAGPNVARILAFRMAISGIMNRLLGTNPADTGFGPVFNGSQQFDSQTVKFSGYSDQSANLKHKPLKFLDTRQYHTVVLLPKKKPMFCMNPQSGTGPNYLPARIAAKDFRCYAKGKSIGPKGKGKTGVFNHFDSFDQATVFTDRIPEFPIL
jgi:hypothetical protein